MASFFKHAAKHLKTTLPGAKQAKFEMLFY
jgi:hypothetical protein